MATPQEHESPFQMSRLLLAGRLGAQWTWPGDLTLWEVLSQHLSFLDSLETLPRLDP